MRRGTTFSCRASKASSSLARAMSPGSITPWWNITPIGPPARTVTGEALVQLLRRQPRDVEVHRQLRQQPERLAPGARARAARSQLDQRLAGVARAAVPRRREERVDAVAQQRPQPLLTRARCPARCSRYPRAGPNSHLRPSVSWLACA